MAEPARLPRPVAEPTCATCPLGVPYPVADHRNGLPRVECRANPRPVLRTAGYFCGQHPGRHRDRLAARAMQAIVSHGVEAWSPEHIAMDAYALADAMLEEGGHAV